MGGAAARARRPPSHPTPPLAEMRRELALVGRVTAGERRGQRGEEVAPRLN